MYDPKHTFMNPKLHLFRPKLGPKLRDMYVHSAPFMDPYLHLMFRDMYT